MLTTSIKRFQTPLDFAAQFAGSADALIAICKLNNFSITDDIAPGTLLNYEELEKSTTAYFRKRGLDITTDLSNISNLFDDAGVGYDVVDDDLTVYEN